MRRKRLRPVFVSIRRIWEVDDIHHGASHILHAESLDQASRTLLTQLEVDNSRSLIRPGSYAEVQFEVPGGRGNLHVPANCLLFRGDGLSVVTVDSNSRLQIKPVTLGRDMGKVVEVLSGIGAQDRVVVNPSDSAVSGILVTVK